MLLREKEGLTRQQAAEILQVTKERLFAMEMDNDLPEMDELQRITDHFNIDMDLLVANTELDGKGTVDPEIFGEER